MKMICDMCGRSFKPGIRPDGLPNGVGYECEDGQTFMMCTPCIIKLGESEEAQNEFKERFGEK